MIDETWILLFFCAFFEKTTSKNTYRLEPNGPINCFSSLEIINWELLLLFCCLSILINDWELFWLGNDKFWILDIPLEVGDKKPSNNRRSSSVGFGHIRGFISVLIR